MTFKIGKGHIVLFILSVSLTIFLLIIITCYDLHRVIESKNEIHHAHLICYNYMGEEIINKDVVYKKSGIEVFDDNILVLEDINGYRIIFRGNFILTERENEIKNEYEAESRDKRR